MVKSQSSTRASSLASSGYAASQRMSPRRCPYTSPLTFLSLLGVTTPGTTTAHQQSAPALIRQVAITPGVEHQEGPEDLSMIHMARKVLADESRDRGGLEQSP